MLVNISALRMCTGQTWGAAQLHRSQASRDGWGDGAVLLSSSSCSFHTQAPWPALQAAALAECPCVAMLWMSFFTPAALQQDYIDLVIPNSGSHCTTSPSNDEGK